MIQDASPVRTGFADAYDAMYEVNFVTGPTYTLDVTKLPSGFSVSRNAAGLLDVVFPTGFDVQWMGGGVDVKVSTDATLMDVAPVNVNAAAGTMQVAITNRANPPVKADPPTTSDVYFTLRLKAL